MTTIAMRCPSCGMNLEHDTETNTDRCRFCGYERRWREHIVDQRRRVDRVRNGIMRRRP